MAIQGRNLNSIKTSIREILTTDKAHPDTFNPIIQDLIDNDVTLEQLAISYVDEQIQYVTATGVPKLVSYPYTLTADSDNQTSFTIPLESFEQATDTVILFQNSVALDPNTDYSITGRTITLVKGVSNETVLSILVLKNVPMGEEGSVTAKVLGDGTLGIEKFDNELKQKISVIEDYEYQTPIVEGSKITLNKVSNTNILKFILNEAIEGDISILVNGVEKVLNDLDGNQIASLDKGFFEVVEQNNFFILRSRSGLSGNDMTTFVNDINTLILM